jgi:hypothetical protein
MARKGNAVLVGFSAVDKDGAEDQTVDKGSRAEVECRCLVL